MIEINEAKPGDCVWCLLTIQSMPIFAEIVRVLESENAVEVNTDMWGRRVVMAPNAYWEEKMAKKGKIVKIEHNYKQWAQEYFRDEETETDNRIDPIHNGPTEILETSGKEERTTGVPKRSKRKQRVVRKSSTKERKTKRNRKTRRKKE